MDRQAFIHKKIDNILNIIKQELGTENLLYADFLNYKANIQVFIETFKQLMKSLPNKTIEKEYILWYLNLRGLQVQTIKPEIITKIQDYFNMFIDILQE